MPTQAPFLNRMGQKVGSRSIHGRALGSNRLDPLPSHPPSAKRGRPPPMWLNLAVPPSNRAEQRTWNQRFPQVEAQPQAHHLITSPSDSGPLSI